MTELEQEDEFTILTEQEVEEACKDGELAQIERAIDEVKADTEELSDGDITDMVTNLRQLEEKLILWREVRQQTILQLREVADYIDTVAHKTGIAKVVGSGGGVLAGGLTIAGPAFTYLKIKEKFTSYFFSQLGNPLKSMTTFLKLFLTFPKYFQKFNRKPKYLPTISQYHKIPLTDCDQEV